MVARSQSLETARVLRIGYVSADLRSHSVAYFLEPVLEARDRNAIHVTCYANRAGRDATTNRLRALSDEWRVIDGMNDDDALALIRNDEIDILVDLSGHTGRNRMPLFARRAAPIQVTYIGYPNTTGLATMDYRLTDAWADPVGLTDKLNTEELVRLDGGYLCYRPPVDSPPVGEPPVLTTRTDHLRIVQQPRKGQSGAHRALGRDSQQRSRQPADAEDEAARRRRRP